ncbi:alkylhydroperoxidase [Saccharomonospora sp. CUA-673]|uniref:carboxymuconolactone decarboxylase family protein n=1 Tax=Saccharomonospora sp. CUA-673 TaxID=1904969 RepID=UPI000965B135|nr:carboxymuconolactone decarboxylase family protein [Saccharomonospora sp. CUA-673]OLT40647.1 alkylhydroperoxidase [Saccharomonospora sp. CUA-673]
MQGRITELPTRARDGYAAMVALEGFIAGTPIPAGLRHLIKLRVSQINGCAFCVDMHAREARADGESNERIDGVAAFREMPYFDDAERAALALAEAATRLADNPHGVDDQVWDEARRHYDEDQLAALTMTIAAINAWNRISVTNRTVPGSFRR